MSDVVTEGFPFKLRRLGAEDQPAILDLLRLTLGEKASTRKTDEYWRWKHVVNPFGESYAVCAEEPVSHDVAGLRTLMRWCFLDRSGEEYQGARAVDTATHPDYQRRGIFSALTRFAIDELRRSGASFIFNTPNANSLPGYLKMGWSIVARWPVYVRPVRPFRTSLRAITRAGADGPPPSVAGCGLIDWKVFRAEHSEVLGEMIAGHERGRTRTGYRTKRDATYLDWRYGAHPDVHYGVHAVKDDSGELTGFLVGRPTLGARGLTAMVLTEIFVRDGEEAHMRRVLRSAMRNIRCDYWIAHFSKGTPELAVLRRSGYLKAPGRGYTWTALILNATPLDPLEEGSWDLTLGELEIF